MFVYPLTINEQAWSDYTHLIVVDADDLTQSTVTTAQLVNLINVKAGDIIGDVCTDAKAFFQNTGDAAFNSSSISIGDTSSVTAYTAVQELNLNAATPVKEIRTAAPTIGPYTAANTLKANFIPLTGKALSALNRGEIHIYIKLIRPDNVSLALANRPITTK